MIRRSLGRLKISPLYQLTLFILIILSLVAANGKNYSNVFSYILGLSDNIVLCFLWFLFRHLRAYPKGYNNANYLSLFLGVAVPTSLPSGWRRHTKFRLTLVNQSSDKLSQSKRTGKVLITTDSFARVAL